MARFIDHEAETPDGIFDVRNQKAALVDMMITLATTGGYHLGYAGMMIGTQRRDDDPVFCMRRFKRPAVLLVGFARRQHVTGDRLPCIRLPVLERLLRDATLVCGEKIRKSDRDSGPAAVLLVKPLA